METKSWPFVLLLLSLHFGISLDQARIGDACKPSRSWQFLPQGDLYCYYRQCGTKSGWGDTKPLFIALCMFSPATTAENGVRSRGGRKMLKSIVDCTETLQEIGKLLVGIKGKNGHLCLKTRRTRMKLI